MCVCVCVYIYIYIYIYIYDCCQKPPCRDFGTDFSTMLKNIEFRNISKYMRNIS